MRRWELFDNRCSAFNQTVTRVAQIMVDIRGEDNVLRLKGVAVSAVDITRCIMMVELAFMHGRG